MGPKRFSTGRNSCWPQTQPSPATDCTRTSNGLAPPESTKRYSIPTPDSEACGYACRDWMIARCTAHRTEPSAPAVRKRSRCDGEQSAPLTGPAWPTKPSSFKADLNSRRPPVFSATAATACSAGTLNGCVNMLAVDGNSSFGLHSCTVRAMAMQQFLLAACRQHIRTMVLLSPPTPGTEEEWYATHP